MAHTFFVKGQDDLRRIDEALRRFWEIEGVNPDQKVTTATDADMIKTTTTSSTWSNDKHRYQVCIPWNENKSLLPNNYNMAYKRLVDTEKQLSRKPQIKEFYKRNLTKRIT